MKILIVVDMQEDFVNGSLGTPEARYIVRNVVSRIKEYNANEDLVLYTMDTHGDNYFNTQEGRKLPVEHCIPFTKGYQIVKDIKDAVPILAKHTIPKQSFGTIKWESILKENLKEEIEKDGRNLDIEIIGVCTDICVVSNALILKAIFPEAEISVDAYCCAGTTPDNHKAALQVMECCQINIKE